MQVTEETEHTISFLFGHSLLTFHATDTGNPFYHFAFLIPNNKLYEAIEWVKERTSVLPYSQTQLVANFKGWNAEAFYFHDGGYNILEFITHYDLQIFSDKPFSLNSLSGICEAGIVVKNVAETCSQLHKNNRIPYFKKGPFMNDFAVMGEEHGMFIISSIGRGWLPTMRPAERNRVEVLVQNNGTEKTFVFD